MWNQCRYRIACLSADIFIIFVSLSQLVLLFLLCWSVANLHNNYFTWKMPYLQGREIAFGAMIVIALYEMLEVLVQVPLVSDQLKGKGECKEDVVRCFKLILEWLGPFFWMMLVVCPIQTKDSKKPAWAVLPLVVYLVLLSVWQINLRHFWPNIRYIFNRHLERERLVQTRICRRIGFEVVRNKTYADLAEIVTEFNVERRRDM